MEGDSRSFLIPNPIVYISDEEKNLLPGDRQYTRADESNQPRWALIKVRGVFHFAVSHRLCGSCCVMFSILTALVRWDGGVVIIMAEPTSDSDSQLKTLLHALMAGPAENAHSFLLLSLPMRRSSSVSGRSCSYAAAASYIQTVEWSTAEQRETPTWRLFQKEQIRWKWKAFLPLHCNKLHSSRRFTYQSSFPWVLHHVANSTFARLKLHSGID